MQHINIRKWELYVIVCALLAAMWLSGRDYGIMQKPICLIHTGPDVLVARACTAQGELLR